MSEFEVVRADGRSAVAYCSMKAQSVEEKKVLYNATSSPAERVTDHINETITIKDIFVEAVEVTDDNTGLVHDAPRVVLITPEGVGYVCVSKGIFNSIKRIIAMFGEPQTWEAPLTVKVLQTKRGSYNINTLEVV